jgi:hypothetical protein
VALEPAVSLEVQLRRGADAGGPDESGDRHEQRVGELSPEPAQPARIDEAVVVGEGDELALAECDAPVAGAALPGDRLEHVANVPSFADLACGVRCGRVVDHDHLVGGGL